MATNAIGKLELAKHIPTIVANMALGVVKSNLFLTRTVRRDFSTEEFGKVGDKLQIPVTGSVSVSDKAADTVYTVSVPTSTDVTLTLNKHKALKLRFEDVARAMVVGSPEQIYLLDAAVKMAEAIEGDGFALYSGLSQSAGTQDVDITEDVFLSGRKLLQDAKVPKGTKKYFAVSTKDEKAMLKIDRVVRANERGSAGPGALETGILGTVHGVDVWVSQNVKVATGTHNIMYAPDFAAFASRRLPLPEEGEGAVGAEVFDEDTGVAMRLVKTWNPEYGAREWILECLYGWVELRDAFGVRVLT